MPFAGIRGFASRISATPPATCGDDIEVPERVAVPPSSSGYEERMPPPGAPILGLKLRSGGRPKLLNPESNPPVPKGKPAKLLVHVRVVGPAAMAASRVAPWAAVMVTTGMVMAGVPSTVIASAPATLL